MQRFSVSLESSLLDRFDTHLDQHGYGNRSEAVRDLIRDALVDEAWQAGKEVTGVITYVYDHHQRQLQDRVTEVQHHHHDIVVATTHVHLDHDHCLEVAIVKGQAEQVRVLADQLKALRGVQSARLAVAGTGRVSS